MPFLCSVALTASGADSGYDDYFDPLLADGFDFPVGNAQGKGAYKSPDGRLFDGWYVATKTAERYSLGVHTGEDWNGRGGGDTDFGQPVYSIGRGVVLAAAAFGKPWGNVVLVKHRFINNHRVETVYALYAHLGAFYVREGEILARRRLLGTIGTGDGAYPAHLHLEIRRENMARYAPDYWPSKDHKTQQWIKEHYYDPSEFIREHRNTIIPRRERQFILVSKGLRQLFLFEKGRLAQTFEIALSQNPDGHKQVSGDNRTPEGAYRIVQKSRGPFSGHMAAWFGSGWLRINYPNPFDIERGYEKGWIDDTKRARMLADWRAGRAPDKATRLGGGIGIHGWNGDWSDRGNRNLTWGCVSMHNEDLSGFIGKIAIQTLILIVP